MQIRSWENDGSKLYNYITLVKTGKISLLKKNEKKPVFNDV